MLRFGFVGSIIVQFDVITTGQGVSTAAAVTLLQQLHNAGALTLTAPDGTTLTVGDLSIINADDRKWDWCTEMTSHGRHSVWNHRRFDCFEKLIQCNKKEVIQARYHWPYARGLRGDSLTIVSMSWRHHDSSAIWSFPVLVQYQGFTYRPING